jgi:hypothetical protein
VPPRVSSPGGRRLLRRRPERRPRRRVVLALGYGRRRELEFLEGVLAGEAEPHLQMRLFLEELVRERPDEDIRILAARRSREHSEEGRERLTRAMRERL